MAGKPNHQQPSRSGSYDLGQLTPSFDFMTQQNIYSWSSCTKNPGHKTFIPARDFTKDHLPPEYCCDDVVFCIRALSDLTVRITANFTSQNRLPGDVFYRARGKKFGHIGSGTVTKVKLLNSTAPCGCQECRQSEKPQIEYASICIKTAHHVVYDQSEVDDTIVDFFYDDETNITNVQRLFGSKMIDEPRDDDISVFECLTHNKDLANKLHKTLVTFEKLRKDLKTNFSGSQTNLAVIASHPHGCCKHITIGKLIMPEHTSTIPTSTTSEVQVMLTPDNKVICVISQAGGSHVREKHISPEAFPTGIEVFVELPDGTSCKRVIWQLFRPAKETKEWLLSDGGISTSWANLEMVMELPGGDTQVMDDDMNLDYYWNDLSQTIKLFFKEKIPVETSPGTGTT